MNKTLLLAVTAAFALAACGQDSAPNASATPKSAPPAASAPAAVGERPGRCAVRGQRRSRFGRSPCRRCARR